MEELINALKVIQKECKKQQHCDRCPMGTDSGICLIDGNGISPNNWKIIEPKEIIRVMEE